MKKVSCLFFIYFSLLILLPLTINGFTDSFSFNSREIELYDIKEERKLTLEVEQYIIGVVAAEMPASFNIEALKAQAVAARTYALKNNEQRLLTSDSTRDQAWFSREELLERWGIEGYLFNYLKIAVAVDQTSNLVLKYNNDLANSVYHSTSGDYTATAKEVWGSEVDYLRSVNSKYDRFSPYYNRIIEYKAQEIKARLGVENYENMEIVKRSPSGRVVEVEIANKRLTGREMRAKLNLYSTNFQIEVIENGVRFINQGYGHGVGMSQYGADGMGKAGYSFREILAHYYPGTELENYQ